MREPINVYLSTYLRFLEGIHMPHSMEVVGDIKAMCSLLRSGHWRMKQEEHIQAHHLQSMKKWYHQTSIPTDQSPRMLHAPNQNQSFARTFVVCD